MTATPPWGDAEPLPGCQVIRPAAGPPPVPGLVRKKSAVVRKVLALNRFLDRTARTMHPTAALIWLLLLRDERGGTVAAGVADLARRAGVSVATVKRHLRVLRAAGLAVPVRRGRPASGPTTYRLRPTRRRPTA